MLNSLEAPLLRLRYLQCKRMLLADKIGAVLIFIAIGVLMASSCQVFQNRTYSIYYTVALFFVGVSIQLTRSDKAFVYNNIYKPHQALFLEYSVGLIPLIISSLFTINWFCFPISISLFAALPFVTYTLKLKTRFASASSVFSAKNFEWLSGFRKSYMMLIPLYVLALAFSWVKFFPLFILWFLTTMMLTFYSEHESLSFLRAQGEDATTILRQKMLRHTLLLVGLYSPVFIINTIFHSDFWIVNVLFLCFQCSLICFSVCYKYYMYWPRENSTTASMLPTLLAVGSLIPFVAPVPFVLIGVYYVKAKNNLNFYLRD